MNLNIILIRIIELLYLNLFFNVIIKKIYFDVYLFYILIYYYYKRKNRFIIYKFNY